MEAERHKTQSWQAGGPGELRVCFQLKAEGRRRPASQLDDRQAEKKNCASLSPFVHSGLELIGWDPPTLRRAICFTQPTYLSVHLTWRHAPGHTQSNVEPNIQAPHST